MKSNRPRLLAVLLLIGISFSFLFLKEKQKNSALQLKINLLKKEKKKALSWKEFKSSNARQIKTQTSPSPPAPNPAPTTSQSPATGGVQEESSNALVSLLETTMKDLENIDIEELLKSIEAVDELITRNPEVYSLHKAKLILLLNQELVHSREIDEGALETTIRDLSEFDILSNDDLKKEALLIARSNAELDAIDNQINELELNLEEAESDEEELLIEEKIIAFESKAQEIEDQVEEDLLRDENNAFDDLLDIPFYRNLAKGMYQTVVEEADLLLSEFPNSVRAYFFKIKALELSGQNDRVAETIQQAELDPDGLRELETKLNRSKNEKMSDFWKKLRF